MQDIRQWPCDLLRMIKGFMWRLPLAVLSRSPAEFVSLEAIFKQPTGTLEASELAALVKGKA